MTHQSAKPHSRRTRIMHAAIAILVIGQALTSNFMTTPKSEAGENLFFEVHEYSGLLMFTLIFGFWLHALRRKKGTPPSRLFPWFSSIARTALWKDVRHYGATFRRLRLPEHEAHAPFPSAFHGLGIISVMIMTATGVSMFAAMKLGFGESGVTAQIAEVHHTLAKLVWGYLILHFAAAFANQIFGKQALSDMWSVSRDRE